MSELNGNNPIELFQEWLALATEQEINDPNAMCLATSTKEGIPSSRMVLLKSVGEQGFCFNTNKTSNKAKDLLENPIASLTFHWKSLRRQVRVVGKVVETSVHENQKYFETRATISQMGAWASKQSQPLPNKKIFIDRVKKMEEKFANTNPVPCPDHWGGFRIIPNSIELWIDGENRLHDRFLFTKNENEEWQSTRLYP